MRARFTIYLDRVRDSARATPAARAELVALLQSLIREIEAIPAEPGPGRSHEHVR